MKNFDAVTRIRLLNSSDAVKWKLVHNSGSGVNMTFYNEDGKDCGGFSCASTGGILSVLDSNEYIRCRLYDGRLILRDANNKIRYDNNLGGTYIYNSSGSVRSAMSINGYDRGQLSLYDETATAKAVIYGDGGISLDSNITLIGNTGIITCIRCDQTSSRKVKENIKPIADSEKILELRAVSFDFKDAKLGTDKRGFIAEEVAEVLPNLVTPETENSPAALDYIGMIPYLQDVIKKQEQRIQALEEKINKLGG